MEGYYLFFDCECTGLSSEDDITQLALISTDKNLKIVSCKNLYFDTDKIISEEVFNITKVDNEMLKKLSKGQRFKDRVEEILSWFEGKVIIGHNIEFDIKMVKSNALRCGKDLKFKSKICTMKRYVNLLHLPGGFDGQYKNPNLRELSRFASHERKETVEDIQNHFLKVFNMDGTSMYHDALYDTFVTYYCFTVYK